LPTEDIRDKKTQDSINCNSEIKKGKEGVISLSGEINEGNKESFNRQ
jgi:hypothetical protein